MDFVWICFKLPHGLFQRDDIDGILTTKYMRWFKRNQDKLIVILIVIFPTYIYDIILRIHALTNAFCVPLAVYHDVTLWHYILTCFLCALLAMGNNACEHLRTWNNVNSCFEQIDGGKNWSNISSLLPRATRYCDVTQTQDTPFLLERLVEIWDFFCQSKGPRRTALYCKPKVSVTPFTNI